ncbi:MAG: alpha-glucan family phosphorylase [Pyrinomonadaceae bacterium]
MKEFTSAGPRSTEIADELHGINSPHQISDAFAVTRTLPNELKRLVDISMNFYWSWQPEGAEIFRGIDPEHWDKCEQNPRHFLDSVSGLRLWQAALDEALVQRIAEFAQRMDAYLGEGQVDLGRLTTDGPAAYFCAEYGIHNSLPTYSGGLGILAGDHLKSASDLHVPLVGIGLLYRYGYFRQRIAHDGWQEEDYLDVFESKLALGPVLDSNGERLKVMVHIRGTEVLAQAWLASVGRIRLYLLDTNVPENRDVDKLITGHLYGGTAETRIVQEKILGIGGVRLLRKLGISPSVYHLNEGHSAFLTLELAREFMAANTGAEFEAAVSHVREQCVFTTHTPVSAGNDIFSIEDLRNCFDSNFITALRLSEDEFFDLGRVDPSNDGEAFGMTPLAIRMCRSVNGVSRKHGDVSRGLWAGMFTDLGSADDVPITHVTNGVHHPTWIAPALQRLYREVIGPDWDRTVADPERWRQVVASLDDAAIWTVHLKLKNLLIEFLRLRTKRSDTGGRDTINEHLDTHELLSPDVLTVGFARRVAAYKRWDLLLSDMDRLLALVDSPERPVQFVFAGKAHPQDRTAKEILQQLMSINHGSNWQRRAVFVEDYDQEVARYLVQGVDVWMNVPRRPFEASGTSGMKAAMNGALNFSVLDGWWIEGHNGVNGFAIGPLEPEPDEENADEADAGSLYQVLETQIVPDFYDLGENGLPTRWIARMKNSIATITPQFASDRMVMDYIRRIYDPADQRRDTHAANGI